MENAKETMLNSLQSLCGQHFEYGHFTHVHFQCGSLFLPKTWAEYSMCKSPLNRYDLASLAKAIVTSPLVFSSLAKEGKALSCSLKEWLGNSPSKFSQDILRLPIASLLSHRSGLPDWRCLWAICLDENYQRLEPRDRLYFRLNQLANVIRKPGEYIYSDIGFIILGMLLEEKYELGLDKQFEKLKIEMGLSTNTLSFNTELWQREQSIPVGYCPVRQRTLKGEVHDENASVLNGIMGHAGLFGTAEDIANFLVAMMNTDWGKWLVKENLLLRNNENKMLGLCGWHQGRGDSSRCFANGNSIGHLGFTGTAFWLEPNSHLYGILLSNRVIERRISPWITDFRANAFALMDKYLGSLR